MCEKLGESKRIPSPTAPPKPSVKAASESVSLLESAKVVTAPTVPDHPSAEAAAEAAAAVEAAKIIGPSVNSDDEDDQSSNAPEPTLEQLIKEEQWLEQAIQERIKVTTTRSTLRLTLLAVCVDVPFTALLPFFLFMFSVFEQRGKRATSLAMNCCGHIPAPPPPCLLYFQRIIARRK